MSAVPPLIYFLRDGTPVILRTGRILGGGEGRVYQVESGVPQARLKAAKIYLDSGRAQRAEAKIAHMIACRPAAAAVRAAGHGDMLVWPEALLYDGQGCPAGYTMPWVGGAVELEELCIPQASLQQGFETFGFDKPGSMLRRLKALRNIARALAQLHACGRYVWGDLKAQNIMLRPDASVAFIDMDSIQITDGAALRFATRVVSDETAPPEHHDGRCDVARHLRERHWDAFSLAVCAYRLLLGIHPYLASFKMAGHVTLPQAIGQGLFVHGRHRQQVLVLPAPHRAHAQLPEAVRALFMRAFVEGHEHPDRRPTAQEWEQALKPLVEHPGATLRKAYVGDCLKPAKAAAGPVWQVTQFGSQSALQLGLDWADELFLLPDGQSRNIGRQVTLHWHVRGARHVWCSALHQSLGGTSGAGVRGCLTQTLHEDKVVWLFAHLGGLKWTGARIRLPVAQQQLAGTTVLERTAKLAVTTQLDTTAALKPTLLRLAPEIRFAKEHEARLAS